MSNEPPASGVPSRAQAEPVTVTQPVPAARSDSLKGAIVSGRSASRLELEPMDPQIKNIQPGGGVVIQLELAWGRLRRWYLNSLRPNFVSRMRQTRRGDFNPCPHEVLDPRDLKFYRNQGGYFWEPQDDPFLWRDRLPFARVGLAELIVIGGGLLAGAILCFLLATVVSSTGARIVFGLLAATFAVICGLVVWFFRNPPRQIPSANGVVVCPADGKIVTIDEVTDEFSGGPAISVGIFLSIFNVHINRSPIRARVIGLRYKPGKMLNALRPESARLNEQLAVRIEEEAPPHRRMTVRQITGQFARRIVCWLKPGDVLDAGEQFGMIKLGSRTELVLPCETGLEITVKVGEKVLAGSTIVARYRT
ncbi:MAG TPA: phosphatidylserine decarboxylase family protein [Planctomycetaceae bacterium]|nr:phosphatidylserine decarboxylase family protein [Planctomycetaceae bacterium]